MRCGKKALFAFLLGSEALANILELTHVNALGTTTLLAFWNCIVVPGLLIALLLRIKKISFWENLLIIVGLSIAYLEFGGLFINMLFPLLGVSDPLAFQNLVIGFDILALPLFLCAWMRTKPFILQLPVPSALNAGTVPAKATRPGQFVKPGWIDPKFQAIENIPSIVPISMQFPRRSTSEKMLYLLPLFFPILAVLGAIILNNGGSNILTLILLGAIACYSLLLVLLRDKIAVDLFPFGLFFIGLAALFTTSLRSWYITGHDIEREFYIFQLTNAHHIWSMAFYQDAYNACLSITILPTILANLLAIPDMYVYKVIFQILFATAPVLVFFIIRNYAAPVLAFLSAVFFISFPTFFNDMPMLNRQEIGFIFFGLVLYMMLKRSQARQFYPKFGIPHLSELSLPMRRILFIIFALSVIVSHYSTNFVLIALVVFVYGVTRIISAPFVKKSFAFLLARTRIRPKSAFTNNVFLSLPLILVLLLSTYIWNNLYTQSSNHATSVLGEVISSIFVHSNADNQSSDLSYSIFFAKQPNPQQQLQDYIQSLTQEARSIDPSANGSQFYSKAVTSKYPTYPIPQEQLVPTPLGNWLSSLHVPVFGIQAELRSLSADFMQVFVFIGLLCILFFKNKKTFDVQYLLLCVGAVILLVLITVLPAISIEYGVLRMFQQLLFMLSLPIVIGVGSILFFVKEQKRVLFTAIIAIIFFLNLTGFISHLTGDYYPQMTLDNAGLYYDAYYVHKSDIVAIIWLSENDGGNVTVESDLSGSNKLLTYGNINALVEIFPPIIRKNAYVFLEVSSNSLVAIDRSITIFSSPKSFLDDNKNHIYSNGTDNIYK